MNFSKRKKEILPTGRSARKINRKKWAFFITLFLLFGISGTGVYFLIYSDYFQVKSLEIKGTELVSSDVLLATITSQMKKEAGWRTFIGAKNILFWEFGAKPKLLTEISPLIANLNVESNLTERNVVVQVEERELLGIWCGSFKNCYAFDAEGIVFSEAPEVHGVLIMKIEDLNNRTLKLGNKILPNGEWIKNFLKTVKIAKENSVPVAAIKIRDLALREWELKTAWGPVIYFSLDFVPDNLELIFFNLSQRFDLNKLSYLDFRVPNRIYYK